MRKILNSNIKITTKERVQTLKVISFRIKEPNIYKIALNAGTVVLNLFNN